MNNITQGTIISGIRSDKYPNIECKAVIISARCDIANCKINKYFYLTAIPINEWCFSSEGIDKWLIPKLNDNVNSFLKEQDLDLNVLLSFTEDEITEVFSQTLKPKNATEQKKKEKNLSQLLFIRKCKTSNKILKEELDALLLGQNKNWKDDFITYIRNLSTGNSSWQLTFLPREDDSNKICDGFIIDNAEINYFDKITLQTLLNSEMDEKTLTPDKQDKYDKTFFIKSGTGFSTTEGVLPSPWTEYLLQRFSFFFSRIGVYTPTDEQFNKLI